MSNIVLAIEISDKRVEDYYAEASLKHNYNVDKKGSLADSGFDLICPSQVHTTRGVNTKGFTKLINLGIKAAAYEVRNFNHGDLRCISQDLCRAYDLCVRSSIYKSKWRLANNVGIIDASYRGDLHAAMDYNEYYGKNCSADDSLQVNQRYWQIVMPDRKPFKVYIVNKLDTTERGEGGLGSTGDGGLKIT
jgi:dUTP pyrophosphatase